MPLILRKNGCRHHSITICNGLIDLWWAYVKWCNVPPSYLLDFRMFRVQAQFWNVAGRSSFRPLLRTLTHGSRPSYINEIRDSLASRHMKRNQDTISPENALNVVFFSNKHNSMSQRLCLELEKRNHNVKVIFHQILFSFLKVLVK